MKVTSQTETVKTHTLTLTNEDARFLAALAYFPSWYSQPASIRDRCKTLYEGLCAALELTNLTDRRSVHAAVYGFENATSV